MREIPAAAGNTPVPVIAKPQRGCGNPQPPSILLSPPQRAILRAFCVFAFCLFYSFPCTVASGGPLSLYGKERGERNRQREPTPKAVPFGILPHRPGGCGPLEIPRGLRRTRDERLLRVSLSEIKCAMHVHAPLIELCTCCEYPCLDKKENSP